MVFLLIENVVDGTREGVKTALKGIASIGGAIAPAVKEIIVTTDTETGGVATQGVQGASSIVKGAVDGIATVSDMDIDSLQKVVRGTIEGFMAKDGAQEEAVEGVVRQAVRSASEIGLNVGEATVAVINEAIAVVEEMDGDTKKAMEEASVAALGSAKSLEGVYDEVRTAVKSQIEGGAETVKNFEK